MTVSPPPLTSTTAPTSFSSSLASDGIADPARVNTSRRTSRHTHAQMTHHTRRDLAFADDPDAHFLGLSSSRSVQAISLPHRDLAWSSSSCSLRFLRLGKPPLIGPVTADCQPLLLPPPWNLDYGRSSDFHDIPPRLKSCSFIPPYLPRTSLSSSSRRLMPVDCPCRSGCYRHFSVSMVFRAQAARRGLVTSVRVCVFSSVVVPRSVVHRPSIRS